MRRINGLVAAGFLAVAILALVFTAANSVTAKSEKTAAAAPQGNGLVPAIPGNFLTGPNEGQPLEIALNFIRTNRGELQMSEAEVSGLLVTDNYVSERTGTTHIYLVQTHNGIQVYNAVININIAQDGSVINLGNRVVPNLTTAVQSADRQLSAEDALEKAANQLGLEISETPVVEEVIGGAAQAVILSDSGVSQNPIPARLVYQPMANGTVRLAWDLIIYELSGENWWSVRIDVVEGEILAKNNFVDHDNWGSHQGQTGGVAQNDGLNVPLSASAVPSSYLVYDMPVESPNYAVPAPPADARTTEISPWLDAPTASPMGWHAHTTSSWTNTQGNNVDAHKGAIRFDCGVDLECDPALDLTMEPTIPTNVDAATVNLFFWNNIVHDVTYEYGFDEPAGNFQDDNFGLGGLGNDRVNANAQAPGNCNANFGTPPDGSAPTMNMFNCNNATPARDGDLDNGVIAHEYGHGISNRLTGGPGNTSCLGNSERPSEGWSDLVGLLLTIEPGDTGVDPRGIGTWLLGQGPGGPGVRVLRYSTDFTVNDHTYDDIKTMAVPHGVGEVWATMVWDMVWLMIDEYGYNPDFYGDWSTGGNNLAMQLMLDGMKLQPCSPGFVDARDGILLADQNLTGGANQCMIWDAFAGRGLGFSADQGSSGSAGDGTEAFDIPQFCEFLGVQPVSQNMCTGDFAEYEVTLGSAFDPAVTMTASGHPAGSSATFSPNPVPTVPSTTTLTISDTLGVSPGGYTITITGTDSVFTASNFMVGLNVFDAVPGGTTLVAPPDTATDVNFRPNFMWTASTQGLNYLIEVDDDPGFGSIDYSAVVSGTSHIPSASLSALTTYYWRVTPMNSCGSGTTSSVFSFTTQESSLQCNGGVVDFDLGIPGDWNVTVGGGNATVFWADLAGCGEAGNWTGGAGDAACASSDHAPGGGGGNYDTELQTPPIDLSGFGLPTLTYKVNYANFANVDFLDVDVSTNGGVDWTTLLSWNEDHGSTHALPGEDVSLDLASYVGQEIILRWHYYDPSGTTSDDWYAQVDDVNLSCISGPAIQFEKTVGTDPNVCATTDDLTLLGANDATYCYNVLNTGTVTLTNHDLDDSELGSILSGFPFSLSPAQSTFVTVTTPLTQSVVNTATWTAYNPGPTDVVSGTDSASVKVVQPTQLPVNEGFESGDLPDYMYSEVTTNATSVGRVRVTNSNPHSGNFALEIDTECSASCGPDTIQAALLAVDLGGVSQVTLDFWVDEHGDENNPEDGVFISDDGGVTWALIHSLNNSPAAYTNVVIDLDDAVANAGMSLVDGFLLKFQSLDDFSITTDGYSFDDIMITEDVPAPDINVTPGGVSSSQFANEVMTDTFTIENLGNLVLNWTSTEAPSDCNSPADVPWVSASPSAGSIPSSGNTAVDVVFDSTGLTPAVYNAKLCISSDDPDEPEVEVDLTLTVEERPVINLSAGNLSETLAEDEVMTQTLTISNTGDADLDWTIAEGSGVTEGACGAPSDLPWVSVDPTSGTTAAGNSDDVAVVFDATGIAPGDYSGELCISSDAPDSPEVVVTLSLTVVEADYTLYMPSVHKPDTSNASAPLGLLPLTGLFLVPAFVLSWRSRK